MQGDCVSHRPSPVLLLSLWCCLCCDTANCCNAKIFDCTAISIDNDISYSVCTSVCEHITVLLVHSSRRQIVRAWIQLEYSKW